MYLVMVESGQKILYMNSIDGACSDIDKATRYSREDATKRVKQLTEGYRRHSYIFSVIPDVEVEKHVDNLCTI